MASSDNPRSDRSPMAWRSKMRSQMHDAAHAESAPPPQDLPDHPLVPKGEARVVVDDAALSELIAHLRSAGSFAYDTEFIGELTYHPQLCLVQVATAQQVALIDPFSDVDLAPFWALLTDPGVEKVTHAGPQDIEPVFRHTGKPAANVFDTQLAAGFCAMAYPVSLLKLVGELLNYRVAKGLTFTDWQRRPLSANQLRYAADDVRFLPGIRADLGTRLAARGHTAWARAEFDTMCDPARYEFDAERDYRNLRGAPTLSTAQLAVLRSLMMWRDEVAQQQNCPPRALLKDELLVDLAKTPCKHVEKLGKYRNLPKPVETAHGRRIVELTLAALANPPKHITVVKSIEPTPSERFRADSLWAAAQAICVSQGIDPAVVTSKQEISELDALLQTPAELGNSRLMSGWRREALGQPLYDLVHHGKGVTLNWAAKA